MRTKIKLFAFINLIAALAAFLNPVQVYALPENPKVVSGDVSFERVNDNTLNITASNKAIINFGTFNIAQGETVNFIQPNISSTLLSRVTGGTASQLFGGLSANGILFLVNPSGIHFGSTSNVQVGGLVASTLDISNQNFLKGNYLFGPTDQTLRELSQVFNEGRITTRNGGFALLLGPAVANTGTIQAPIGTVALASGEVVTVGISPDNLISIGIDKAVSSQVLDANGKPITDQISNKGKLSANGGTVRLNAQSAEDIFHRSINLEGVVEANKVVEKNGAIEIVASGAISNTGTLESRDGSLTLQSQGDIVSSGILRADTLIEKGGSFKIGGVMSVGHAYIENKDGAVEYSTNTSLSGTILDVDNIIIDSNVVINLTGDTIFQADSDNDGVGAFTMNSGSSIVGNSHALTLYTSGQTATLESITNTSSLTLNASSGSAIGDALYTLNKDLTVANLNIGNPTALLLNGHNLSVSGTLSNEGGIGLIGSETVTLTHGNDIDSGLWAYFGNSNGAATTYTIKDFGITTDYYDLQIGDGPVDTDNNDVFLLANPLSTAGKLTVRDGIFNANGKTATFKGAEISGGTFTGGAGTVDCNGNFTITDDATGTHTPPTINMAQLMKLSGDLTITATTMGDGTAYSKTAVLEFYGTGTQKIDMGDSAEFPNITHSGSGTLQLASGTNLTVKGNLTNSAGILDNNGQNITVLGNWVGTGGQFKPIDGTVTFSGGTGAIQNMTSGTGNNFFNLVHDGAGTAKLLDAMSVNGTMDLSNGIHDANGKTLIVTGLLTLSGGEYRPGTANQTFNGGVDITGGTLTGSTGTIDINGDLNLSNTPKMAAPKLVTISGNFTDNTTNNPGDGMTPVAGATMEFDGTSDQTINASDHMVGFLNMTYSGAHTLTVNVDLEVGVSSITGSGNLKITNADGVMDIKGNDLTVRGTLTNNGTIQLQGNTDQTVTLSKGNDIDSGVWFYYGVENSTGETYTIKDFGATDYYTLDIGQFTTDTNDTFQIGAALNMGGKFYVSGGTFDAKNFAVTVTELTSIGGSANYLAGTGLQTFNEGLLFSSSGTFTSTTGSKLDVNNGYMEISVGTFIAPTGTGSSFTFSGDEWQHFGGTFNANGGTVTFDGASSTTQAVYTSGGTHFYNLVHSGTSTVQMQSGNSLNVDNNLTISNANGVLDLAGENMSVGNTLSNSGKIKLTGGQTIALTNGNDISHGTWEYYGSTNGDIIDFGTTDYYNVTINRADDTYSATLQNPLAINGALTIQKGIFDANGQTATVTGLTKIQGGEYLAGTGTQTFNGGVSLEGGALTGGTGTNIDVNGNFAMSGGTLDPPENVSISGNWNKTGGTISAGNSTVTFDGTLGTTQTISDADGTADFDALIHSGTGTVNLLSNLKTGVGRDFINSAGTWTSGSHAMEINGPLILSGGTFNAPSSTLTVNYNNIDLTGLTAFNHNNGTFLINGSLNLTSAGKTFNNIQIGSSASSAAAAKLMDNADINGSLTFDNSNGTTSFDLNGKTLNYAGSSLNLSHLTTLADVTGSTVIFDGTTTLTSAGQKLMNVQIGSATGGGSLTLADNTGFDGNLSAANGGTTVFNISNRQLSMGGNLDLTNLDTFTQTGSTVIFNGTTDLTSAGKAFNKIQLGSDTDAGSLTLLDNADFNGDFTVKNGGTTTFDINGKTVSFSGSQLNLTNLDNLNDTAGNSTIIFDGTTTLTANGAWLDNIQLGTATAGGSLTLGDDNLGISGNFSVANITGITVFNLNSKTLNVAGNFNLTNLDTFTVTGSTVSFMGNTTLTSAGKSFNNVAIGTGSSSGTLELADTADFNGALTFDNTVGSSLDLNGKTLNYSGSTLNFTDLGTLTSTSSTIVFDGTTTLTSAGKSLNNVQIGTTTAGASLTLADTADFNGNFTVANITGTTIFDVNGNTANFAGSNLNLTNLDNLQDTAGGATLIFDGTTTLTSAGKTLGMVQIGSLTSGGSLTLGDNAHLDGNLTFENGGATTFSLNSKILTFSGSAAMNFTNADTVTSTGSTIIFDGTTTLTSAGKALNNIQLGTLTSGASLTLADTADFNGNLTVLNGGLTTFDANSQTINFAGTSLNFTNLDNLNDTGSASKIIFDGTATTLTSAGKVLNEVQIGSASTGGSLTLGDNTNFAGNLSFGSAASTTFNLNTKTLTFSGTSLDLTNADTVSSASSTVIFTGTTSLTSAGKALGNVQIGNSSTGGSLTLADKGDFNGNLTIGTAGTTTLNLNGQILNFAGANFNLTNLTNFTLGGGDKITFDGATTLTSNSRSFPMIQIGGDIAGVGGSLTLADDLKADNPFSVTNNGTTVFNITNRTVTSTSDFNLTNLDTFTSTGSTMEFAGDGQTITSASKTYNNIKVTGGTSSGVTFADAFSTANFEDSTAGSILKFAGNKIYNITGILTLNGQATGTKIQLISSTPGTRYTFNLTKDQNVSYVDVQDSQTTGFDIIAKYSTDAGNNDNTDPSPHWLLSTGNVMYWIGLTTGLPWNNGANWSSVSKGTALGSFPQSGDTAIFDIGKITGCTLTTHAEALNLYFQKGYSGTLDANGWDITISNNLSLTLGTLKLSTNLNGTSDLTVAGTLGIGGGILNATSGTIDANNVNLSLGTLTAPTIGTPTLSTPGNFYVSGDWKKTGGTFTAGTGTVIFDGTTNLTSGLALFNKVQIGNGAGGSLKLLDNADFNNDLTFNNTGSATTLDMNGKTLKYSGSSLDFTNLDTFSASGSTFIFDRAVAGTTNLTANSQAFGNLTKSGLDSLVLQDPLTATGNLTLSKGAFTAPSGNLTVGGNMTLMGLTTFTHNSGTIIFNGITNLMSALKTFNNVQIGTGSTGGSLKLLDNANFDGNLSVGTANSTTFDLNGKTLNFAGSTFDLTNIDTFSSTLSTVIFDGGASTTTLTSAGKGFNNITLGTASTGSSVTLQDAADFNGNFVVANLTGTTTFDINGNTLSFSGLNLNLTNLDNLNDTPGTSTLIFDAAAGTQNLTTTTTSNMFMNVTHSGSGILLLKNYLNVAGNFENSGGTFDAGGKTTTVTGSTTLSGGTYKAGAGKQAFKSGLTINGGTFTGSTGQVDITGDLDLTSGTVTLGAQTLNCSGATTLSGGTFKTVTGAKMNITGNLALDGGTADLTGSTVDVDGNFSWTATSVTKFGTLLKLAGNWSRTGGTLGSVTANTVEFNGSSDQTFSDTGSTLMGFYNLTYSGHNTLFAQSDISISQRLTISQTDGILNRQGHILSYVTLTNNGNII